MTRLRRTEGFTLIETMVSISIFAIMILGVTPLIASSLRGSSLARSFTVAKNLAQESLERMRGLPYFESGINRDLLDLYFPNLGVPGYSAGKFTTTCTSTSSTPAPSADLACPPDHPGGTTSQIPAGYTVTYETEFVVPSGANPETFTVVIPPTGYSSADPALASPPAQLMRVTVAITWTNLRSRSFRLTSLFGNRALSRDQVRASATIDFVVQGFTSFKTGLPGETTTSALSGFAGRSSSAIEIRSFAKASIDSSGGRIRLVSQDPDAPPEEQSLDSVVGAESAASAPPTASISAVTDTDVPVGSNTIAHPELVPAGTQVAGLGDSQVNGAASAPAVTPVAQVVNGLPKAASNFDFTGAVGTEGFWVNNQADTSTTATLKLDPTKRVFSVVKTTSGSRIKGDTYAEATATSPSASRKVEAIAHAAAGKMELMPVTFLVGTDTAVVVIEDFQATVSCNSTGAAGTASGSWSAKIKYWTDNDPGDGLAIGHYEELTNQAPEQPKLVTGSTTGGLTDPLAALGPGNNPLVFDAPLSVNDIYLFDVPSADPTLNREGYLEAWDITETMTGQAEPRSARVTMPQAINIVTARTDPLNEETEMTLQIGKLSCAAVDQR